MFNLPIILLAALIPLVIGFLWYNPNVFGTAWMSASGLTTESTKGTNMLKLLLLSFIFSFFIAFSLQFVVIHQMHIYSLLNHHEKELGDSSTVAGGFFKIYSENYAGEFRTFGHGALHGVLTALFLILPIIATNAIYERKSFKYIMINAGYWTVCFLLMGGIICAFA